MNNHLLQSSRSDLSAKALVALLAITMLGGVSAMAQYYVLARTPNSGSGPNSTGGAANYGNYWEDGVSYADSSGKTSAPGVPPSQSGSRYRTSMTVGTGFDVQLMGDSAPGAVYLLDVSVPSSNDSTDIIYSVASTNATLSATTTSAFQNNVGTSPNWAFVCYVTNNPGVIHPHVQFLFASGNITGTTRSYATAFRFRPAGCGSVNAPAVQGPFSAGQTSVTVGQVTNATVVAVYQDSGSGMVQIGSLTTGIVNGNNTVPTMPLIKGAKLSATQTVGGQESCVPSSGEIVGGGANPRIRISLDIRQTGTMTGPIGATGPATGGGLYFMQATGITNSGPAGGIVVQPSACWQTVKIDPRTAPQSPVWSGSWPGQAYPDNSPWAELECIAFTMDDLADTGPFAIYIDNLANGTNLFQDFEGHNPGEQVTFLQPNAAGFPVGMLINPPNTAEVSGSNASTGTNSEFVNFQFSGGVAGNWVRWYAGASSGAYPQLDMTQPIYFDILLLPLGQTAGHSIGAVGYLQDQTHCPGDTVTLNVNASGPNPLSFQWQFNGADIAGATTSSFTTNNISPASSGIYSVNISDGTCSLVRSANVTALPIAAWDYQPADTTANVGDPGYFSANASPVSQCSGASTLNYQWLFNGQAIADGTKYTGTTTGNLQVNSCQVADAGHYSVIASNALGGVISTSAWLHVVDTANEVFGTGVGLLGLYYSNHLASAPFSPNTPVWTNTDYQIAFEWLDGPPDAIYNNPTLVGSNNFTIRWVGQIQGQWNQPYTFYSTNDDGLRLWINGQLVIDSWSDQSGAVEHSGTIPLTTTPQPIVLEYYQHLGNSDLALSWESASQVKQTIAASQLYPATGYPSVPLIALTAPSGPLSLTNPATVNFAASVTPNLQGIEKVQFFYGSAPTLMGQAVNPPYAVSWTNPPAGSYGVFARAQYDNASEHVDSSPVTLNVTTTPPSISGITGGPGSLSINGTGALGQTFILQTATNLAPPIVWKPVATNAAGSGAFSFSIGPNAAPAAFYRVQSK